MSASTGFNRRSFLQSAGLTALAGASGGVALAGSASAQAAGSNHIPMKGATWAGGHMVCAMVVLAPICTIPLLVGHRQLGGPEGVG